MSPDKVFGIGWCKTGTKTLGAMLKLLGYPPHADKRDYNKIKNWVDEDYSAIINFAKPHEAFEDLPWALPGFYKKLDHAFPNAKFILTTRDPQTWLKSMNGQWERVYGSHYFASDGLRREKLHKKLGSSHLTTADLARILYDFNDLPTNRESFFKNKDKFLNAYNQHNKDAISYFKNKYGENYNRKLLVVDWPSGDGWPELLDFLPVNKNNIRPDHPMPWKNNAAK